MAATIQKGQLLEQIVDRESLYAQEHLHQSINGSESRCQGSAFVSSLFRTDKM